MKQTINYIPVLNLLLITDSLGFHTICIFTENHLEGSKVCFWVAIRSLDLITIGSAIYCNAFFLSWAEQMWQTYELVQMTIYGEHFDLGHIFQDVG